MWKPREKQAPLKTKPYKNKFYLSWLHNQGFVCLVCGVPHIEAHHLDQGAKGRADNRIVMLCPEHHRGKYSPHGANKREFEDKYMDSMEADSERLFNMFKEEECV